MLTKTRLSLAAGVALLFAGLQLSCSVQVQYEPKFGLVENHTELAAPVAASMPAFEIINPVSGEAVGEDNTRRVVKLWAWDELVCGQKFLPHYPQQGDDCVSFAVRRGHIVHQAVKIAKGEPWQWKDIDPTFVYSTGRVIVGENRIRGGGLVMTWAGKALSDIGVVFADQVPPYSLARVKEWEYQAPPAELIQAAAAYRCSVSPVRTVADVTDAICNGYPVPFGSHQFAARRFTSIAGKVVAINTPPYWPHAQCIDGYDGSGSEPLWHVQNSWPLSSHPAPTDDSPPGGYWIRRRDLEAILSDRDIIALSMVKGFPQQALPDLKFFDVAKRAVSARAQHRKTEMAL